MIQRQFNGISVKIFAEEWSQPGPTRTRDGLEYVSDHTGDQRRITLSRSPHRSGPPHQWYARPPRLFGPSADRSIAFPRMIASAVTSASGMPSMSSGSMFPATDM